MLSPTPRSAAARKAGPHRFEGSHIAQEISRPLRGRENLAMILGRLEDNKAEATDLHRYAGKSTIADHMVVASGRSKRHVGAIADQVMALTKHRFRNTRVEGVPHGDWVLVDAGDVIVHVFRPEVREFYNLEKMWARTRPAKG